jgi:hypothetical protein
VIKTFLDRLRECPTHRSAPQEIIKGTLQAAGKGFQMEGQRYRKNCRALGKI